MQLDSSVRNGLAMRCLLVQIEGAGAFIEIDVGS
jgi:hypothetical protein